MRDLDMTVYVTIPIKVKTRGLFSIAAKDIDTIEEVES